MGRYRDALTLLNAAHRLLGRVDAPGDLVHLDGKLGQLEDTYLAVVRKWVLSFASTDGYPFGHSERVAQCAVGVAEALGLDARERMTIRLGAYLHDVGKVKVPHRILHKPGRLTREEFQKVKQHPAWGVELVGNIEFPWDVRPIIRSHHERCDGTGYPEGLRGDQVPLLAQVVGVADVYDALTTERPYRSGLTPGRACAAIGEAAPIGPRRSFTRSSNQCPSRRGSSLDRVGWTRRIRAGPGPEDTPKCGHRVEPGA